ncbi:alpha/beta hydrolase fold domain-containing protein [Flavobacterium sp. LS1R47]|uniref:Alpha/beta hydrolase fold domain-containing protein n=1 Tax=Flavobacterium frigoritolerans TaxID=2987686 RepID=A0A9X3HMN9_9FLAO|nr:alpha/beta hydrolase [Flavobacterium frigoritolerans]MCV9934160.1 alpha/beta hydrolase fold domain-containing protein [Flavobacterium frigoritolerans]
MKMPYLLLLLFISFTSFSITAQEIKTLTYFENDSTKLELDLYLPLKKSDKKIPLVIFAHGGGFSGGDRFGEKDFANSLAKNGIAVASISYTLYMKGKDFGCNSTLPEKIKTIQIGVSDMWQATSFMIKNKNAYNIDASKIFIAGISAGAEIAFHATFWDYSIMNLYSNNLPSGFTYKGLIGGSGAIMNVDLITSKNAIPMLLSHGSEDPTVPYATGSHRSCPTNSEGFMTLSGSYAVYNRVSSLKKNIELITSCGAGHEFCGYLFGKEPDYVLDFINNVIAKRKFESHIIIPNTKKSEDLSQYPFCN